MNEVISISFFLWMIYAMAINGEDGFFSFSTWAGNIAAVNKFDFLHCILSKKNFLKKQHCERINREDWAITRFCGRKRKKNIVIIFNAFFIQGYVSTLSDACDFLRQKWRGAIFSLSFSFPLSLSFIFFVLHFSCNDCVRTVFRFWQKDRAEKKTSLNNLGKLSIPHHNSSGGHNGVHGINGCNLPGSFFLFKLPCVCIFFFGKK